MSADVNTILVAYKGRCDMLRACFGGSDETAPAKPAGPKVSSRPMSMDLFDAMFG